MATKPLPGERTARSLFPFTAKRTAALFLAVAGFIVHLPALQGQLIWDDQFLVRNNPLVRSPLLIFEVFRHYLFFDSTSIHYRPVQNLSLMLDYLIWNNNIYGYHLTNVLLHIGSGILLCFLLRRLFAESLLRSICQSNANQRASLAALIVSLIWIVLPVHSAAVDYISGRADSLAFLFSAAGWLLYLLARKAQRIGWLITLFFIAGACEIAALCSREIAGIWCLLFVLYVLFFERESTTKKKIAAITICICLAGAAFAMRHLPAPRPAAPDAESFSAPMRVVLMFRALGDYGRLLVYPSNLHMDRTVLDRNTYISTASWRNSTGNDYLSILGAAILAVLILGMTWRGPGRRVRIFGALWFLLAFLPISNLFDMNATVAEHWLYLPSVGVLIFLTGSIILAAARPRQIAIGFAAIAFIGFSARSFVRSGDWLDEESFYRKTLAAGGSTTRLATNLGQIYLARGENQKAEEIFRRVLAINPEFSIAKSNLAEVMAREGRQNTAEQLFVSANDAKNDSGPVFTWVAALNLAKLRQQHQDTAGALEVLHTAQHDYPENWEVVAAEGEILRVAHGPKAALPLVEAFTRAHRWRYDAQLALGQLYAEAGETAKAQTAFRNASQLDVHDVKALDFLAAIELKQNNLSAAWEAQRRAVSRQPDQPRQYVMLSSILEKMGRDAEADAATAEAARLTALVQSPIAAN